MSLQIFMNIVHMTHLLFCISITYFLTAPVGCLIEDQVLNFVADKVGVGSNVNQFGFKQDLKTKQCHSHQHNQTVLPL